MLGPLSCVMQHRFDLPQSCPVEGFLFGFFLEAEGGGGGGGGELT